MPLSRSLKQRARTGATKSAVAPAGMARDGNAVAKKDGRARPDAPTANPKDLADPQARVIKTNS